MSHPESPSDQSGGIVMECCRSRNSGPTISTKSVGKGGVEPPRPYGHTDLNRARLPFRHLPEARSLTIRAPAAAVRKISMHRHPACRARVGTEPAQVPSIERAEAARRLGVP